MKSEGIQGWNADCDQKKYPTVLQMYDTASQKGTEVRGADLSKFENEWSLKN